MHQQLSAAVTKPVSFTLNGQPVVAPAGETILEAAERHGVEIPRLCYMAGMRPDGNCRTCMVEIKGERVLAPSCCRYPKDGMEVTSMCRLPRGSLAFRLGTTGMSSPGKVLRVASN